MPVVGLGALDSEIDLLSIIRFHCEGKHRNNDERHDESNPKEDDGQDRFTRAQKHYQPDKDRDERGHRNVLERAQAVPAAWGSHELFSLSEAGADDGGVDVGLTVDVASAGSRATPVSLAGVESFPCEVPSVPHLAEKPAISR